MKKRLLTVMLVTVCIVLTLGFCLPVLGGAKLHTGDTVIYHYDLLGETVCSKCGKELTGAIGEQSPIADALGLTLCTECWFQLLCGNDYTVPILMVAQLGEDGKVLPEQLPAGQGGATWGGITGTLSAQTDLQGVLDSKLSSFTELDPVFGQSIAHGISSGDITNWNGKISANQNITLSGDLSGSGTTSISGTVTGVQGKAITLATGFLKYSGSAWTFDNSTYENTSNKGVASGYAGLDVGIKVPTVNLGGSGASTLTYLRGDQTWATVTASPPDPVTNINLVDEFMAGSLEAGEVGEIGWSFTTTAPTYIASVAGHPGIRRINTSATSGNVNAFWTGSASNNDLIQYNEQWDFTFVVKIPTITTVSVFCGAIDNTVTAVGNQDRYGFEFNPATSAFWRMVTGNGSASTSTNTDITVVAGTWYALRIVRTATVVDYYIDGTLKGSISTTLPDTALSFGAQVQTLTTVARNLDVDFFRATLSLTRVGAK